MKRNWMFVFLLVLLCGCTYKEKHLYISFTVKTLNETDETATISNYVYDLTKDTLEKKVELPYTSQYPLSVYDQKDHSVYYTHRENGSDQLYKISLDTNKVEQLTQDLFAVNEIIPTKDEVFLSAVKDRVLHLYSYKENTLTQVMDDPDLNVRGLNWNPVTETLLFSTYSQSKSDKQMEQGTDYLDLPKTIYTMNLGKDQTPKQYAKTRITELRSLFINDKDEVYGKLEYIYQIQPDGSAQMVAELEKLNVGSFIYMDDDTIYYLTGYDLVSYDRDTKEKTYLCESESKNTIIANAVMLSYE